MLPRQPWVHSLTPSPAVLVLLSWFFFLVVVGAAPTKTLSESQSISVSISLSSRASRTRSISRPSATSSLSFSAVRGSESRSATATVSLSLSVTGSGSLSSQMPSATQSTTDSASASARRSRTTSVTWSDSYSGPSRTRSGRTLVASASRSMSTSETDSVSWSSSRSTTITPPPTPSSTHKSSRTESHQPSGSGSVALSRTIASVTASASSTVSESNRRTQSIDTVSRTHASATSSWSKSPTRTLTPTTTDSRTLTELLTGTHDTVTATFTLNVTASRLTYSLTQQVSKSTSTSITVRITNTQRPPTTTPLPTPTKTMLTKCPLGPGGTPCGNGTCTDTPPYICQCFLSFKLGFWSGGEVPGSVCTHCLQNFWGPGCRNACPGGICTPCNNHGKCFDDVLGNGTCLCDFNATAGFWTGTTCAECAPGYYGPDCRGVCQCDALKGTCRDGVSGNGTCSCVSGRTGSQCDRCASGFYESGGGGCSPCPGFNALTGLPCNGNGECDPSNGRCYCNGNFTPASNCSVSVPDTPNGCIPPCLNNATCTFGACVCPRGFVGPQCQGVCPVTTSSSTSSEICNGKGTCYYSPLVVGLASCACFPGNSSFGFWSNSSNCTECILGYGTAQCSRKCPQPVGSLDSDICSAQSIGVSVSQLCNRSTATCTCPTTRCGDDCSVTTCGACVGNSFGLSCQYTCVNGTVYNFRNSSGRCECHAGFVGVQCDVTCGCSSNVSGSCLYGNASCVCASGYAGRTCSTVCPSTSNGTCSGNGLCDEGAAGSGLCRCFPGYVGVACQTRCQCVDLRLGSCGADGVCVCALSTWRIGSDCGACAAGRSGYDCRTQCSNGLTNRTNCTCLATYGGPGCQRQCPSVRSVLCNGHGTCDDGEQGTGTCLCNGSYVGPSCNCTTATCAALFPNSACDAASGQCLCTLPFGGANCTSCAPQFWGYSCTNVCRCQHGTCERVKGTCTCYSDSTLGFWAGSNCNVCQAGYNLPDCLQVASISTQLVSFQSVYLGGSAFFMAQHLLLIESMDVAIAVGAVVTVYSNISQPKPTVVVQCPMSALISTSSSGCTYVGSWVSTATPNGTSSSSSSSSSSSKSVSLFVAFLCGSATAGYTVFVQEYPILPLGSLLSVTQRAQQSQQSASFRFTIPLLLSIIKLRWFLHLNATDYLALAVTVNFDYSGAGANALYSVEFNAATRRPGVALTSVALNPNLEGALSALVGVDYDAVHGEVLAFGSYDAGGVGTPAQQLRTGVYIFSAVPGSANSIVQRFFSNQYQSILYAAVVAPGFAVMHVSNGTRDLVRVNFTQRSYATTYASATVVTSVDSVVATAYDILTGILIAVANSGSSYKLLRMVLRSRAHVTVADGFGLEMLGSQLVPAAAGDDRRIIDAQISHGTRQLHLLQLNSSGTTVRRFLLYENLAIYPPSASRFRGPVITITGRGYTSGVSPYFPLSVPRCRVQSGISRYETPATVVDSTTLLCTLDASNTSLCQADVVEVAILGMYFTTNGLTEARFQQPRLLGVTPSILTFRSLALSTSGILVNGSGFAVGGRARCRWSPLTSSSATATSNIDNSNVSVIADTDGFVINSVLVNCTPPVLASALPLYVNVACDGFVFTSEAAVTNLIRVVGNPYNITASLSTISVVSAPQTRIPAIDLTFVDAEGSSLRGLVTDRVSVTATLTKGLLATGTMSLVNNDGLFVFDTITLLSPTVNVTRPSIVFRATLLSDPIFPPSPAAGLTPATTATAMASAWVVSVALVIVSGAADHLVLTSSPSASSGIPEVNLVSLVSIAVEDAAGNRVDQALLSSNGTVTATLSLSGTVAPGVSIPTELLDIYPAESMANITVPLVNGGADFSNIAIPNARGGMRFVFRITTNVTRTESTASDGRTSSVALSIETTALVPKCNAGKIRLIGDTSCRSCPAHMVCPTQDQDDFGNATLAIQLLPGYWRSSVFSADAVPCVPSSACVGGAYSGACAAGYDGVLCGLCAPGFGRSIIGGQCIECPGSRISALLFALVTLGAAALLLVLIIASAQNWSVTVEAVITLVLLVSHLQSAVMVGLTGFPFSQYFKDMTSYVGIFSGRMLDYYFSDCVLVNQGLTFYSKIVVFAAMPFIALLLASVCWVVVFLAPDFLKFQRAHDERHVALADRRDVIIRRLARRSAGAAAGGGGASTATPGFVASTHGKSQLSKSNRLRRLADQAELTVIEDQLKNNLKAQGVYPLSDYRLLSVHSLQVVLFFTFHTSVYYCLTVFDCQEVPTGLGSEEAFLVTDNRISCDVPQYRSFRVFGILVSIALFLLVPCLYSISFMAHLRWRPTKVLQRRQLFYAWNMGLKTGSWYWPSVVLFRKGLQAVFAAVVPVPANVHVTVWILVVQLLMLIRMQPYWNYQNTLLEGCSIVSLLIACWLCILFQAYTSDVDRTGISAAIVTVLVGPIPVFFYSALEKTWRSFRAEIKALRVDSEESSSSSSSSSSGSSHESGSGNEGHDLKGTGGASAGNRLAVRHRHRAGGGGAIAAANGTARDDGSASDSSARGLTHRKKSHRKPERQDPGSLSPGDARGDSVGSPNLRKNSLSAVLRIAEERDRAHEVEAQRRANDPTTRSRREHGMSSLKEGAMTRLGRPLPTMGTTVAPVRGEAVPALVPGGSRRTGTAFVDDIPPLRPSQTLTPTPLEQRLGEEENLENDDEDLRYRDGGSDDDHPSAEFSRESREQRPLRRMFSNQRFGPSGIDGVAPTEGSHASNRMPTGGTGTPPSHPSSTFPALGLSQQRPDVLDGTARRVFEAQLRHDEASRRERAFSDLMELEMGHLPASTLRCLGAPVPPVGERSDREERAAYRRRASLL